MHWALVLMPMRSNGRHYGRQTFHPKFMSSFGDCLSNPDPSRWHGPPRRKDGDDKLVLYFPFQCWFIETPLLECSVSRYTWYLVHELHIILNNCDDGTTWLLFLLETLPLKISEMLPNGYLVCFCFGMQESRFRYKNGNYGSL